MSRAVGAAFDAVAHEYDAWYEKEPLRSTARLLPSGLGMERANSRRRNGESESRSRVFVERTEPD